MNTEDQGRGHGILAIGILLGLVTVCLMILIGLQFGNRARDIARAAEVQREVSAQRRAILYDAGRFYCREIEKLKAAERQDARRVYSELDKTLRLLNLKRTPEIERAAKEILDRKLKRYAFTPCPITASDLGVAPKK